MSNEMNEQEDDRNSTIKTLNQEWASIMDAVADFYNQLDELAVLGREIEDSRKELEVVDWKRVSPEKREEVILALKDFISIATDKMTVCEMRFNFICDYMEEVILYLISLENQQSNDGINVPKTMSERNKEYTSFIDDVKKRFEFERTPLQRESLIKGLKLSKSTTVELGDTKRLRIGFSFGSATYYHETSSFSPMGHICFGLKQDGELFSEEYVVFYNHTSTPDKEIVYVDGDSLNPYEERFIIDLRCIPDEVSELMFVMIQIMPEFSDHIVKLHAESLITRYALPNKNEAKEKNVERVLVRLRRNNGWIADICEEFCDIESLIENSNEKV